MVYFSHTIQDALGIHARPSGLISREANKYESDIAIVKGDKRADAKKVFTLMSLGAKKGDTIQIEIFGKDEEIAGKAFKELIEAQL